MAVTSTRSVTLAFAGDVVASLSAAAAANVASPGQEQLVALAQGDNAFTVPTGAMGVTVQMLANAVVVKLKGAGGDSGVAIHKSDPTSIGLDSSQASIILNAASATTVRMWWT